jgi:hypothetical protein
VWRGCSRRVTLALTVLVVVQMVVSLWALGVMKIMWFEQWRTTPPPGPFLFYLSLFYFKFSYIFLI